MPPPGVGALPDLLTCPPPKSTLQILVFFDHRREGQCSEVAAATGLSQRTVGKRLNELVRAGVLDVIQTRSFPSVPRYRILSSHAEIARAASSLLLEMKARKSAPRQVILVRNPCEKVISDSGRPR